MGSMMLGVLTMLLVVGEPLPTASPADVGLSSDGLADLDKAMQAYVDGGKFSGILTMLAREGRVAHVGEHGLMDIDKKTAMRRDAIFRIYSMTKPITTATLMSFYEEGKFQLDDPVGKYIPVLKGLKVYAGKDGETVKLVDVDRPPTILDLMRHTSGFAYGLQPTHPVETLYRQANLLNRASNLDRMMDQLSTLPLIAQPGKRWVYSVSVDVQGKLIEVLSGKRLDEVFQERIFDPLSMKDTGFSVPMNKVERFATNYGPNPGGGLKPIDVPTMSPYLVPAGLLSGGGGLVSTADDYLRFAQMMLNGGELEGTRILKAETVALMTQNQLPEELTPITLGILPVPRTGFGLGVAVRVSAGPGEPPGVTGEYFWGGAASTQFFVSPKERMIGIIMAQYMPIVREHGVEFREKAYSCLTGAETQN
jgi:CubicO group peptidase (beta-lactamase class C family)